MRWAAAMFLAIALPATAQDRTAPSVRLIDIAGDAIAAAPDALRPPPGMPRPLARPAVEAQCNPGGDLCIRSVTTAADTCDVIERSAGAAGLDPHFLARLLWQESRFDPAALSPAGAQGIAQFMPGTAALRGLADPWNPAEAIEASAIYLAELTRRFGNEGIAAVAYNAGERRAKAFLAGRSGLPSETRAYVPIITGLRASGWRDAPPDAPDFTLEGGEGFAAACLALAAQGRRGALREATIGPAWGVVLAANRSDTILRRLATRTLDRHGTDDLRARPLDVRRARVPGAPGRRPTAQIGFDDRGEARAACEALRRAGGYCVVVRN